MAALNQSLPPLQETTCHKKIRLRLQDVDRAGSIARELSISHIASRILAARGFTPGSELTNYLNPTLKEGIPDPSTLKNLAEASKLIADTVGAQHKIAVACDFDVDGLSGGAQVVHFLKRVGASVLSYVPDRFTEGYGLNKRIIDDCVSNGCALLITIDYGTT